jgi:tRNA (cmo5U34)-methyltransferase
MPEYRWNQSDQVAGYEAGAEWIHPHYREVQDRILDSIPFDRDAVIQGVDLGGGSGKLAARFLDRFPRATITVFDQSAPFLELAKTRLEPFEGRGRCVVARLQDDWDRQLETPVQVIFSTSAIHHLEPAEKRELYRRCAARLVPGGVLLNGDEVRPAEDETYYALLEGWWDHMQAMMTAGRVTPAMSVALERWKERNIDRFTEPRVSGDDCHETAAAQIATFRDVGFGAADVVWSRELWAVLRGVVR